MEGGGEDVQAEQRIFRALKITLYDVIMDMCHDTLIQTHRVYSIKSQPVSKLWTLGDFDMSIWVNLWFLKKAPSW